MAVTTNYILHDTLAETIANTWTASDQLLPDVTGLSNGGYVVAYNNLNPADGYIMLNFFDADSNVIGGYKVPYDGQTKAVGEPSITQLANGNVLVTWLEDEALNQGLKGALFKADGTMLGSEIDLSGITTGYATPDVTALSGGGFVTSFSYLGNTFVGVYNNAGVVQGAFISVESIAGDSQLDPVVTALSDGGFAVAFADGSAVNSKIYARTYDADGTARTANPILVDDTGDNTKPAIAALPNGSFVVAYVDSAGTGEGATTGIVMRILDANGTVTSAYVDVNDPTNGAGKNEADPAITVLDNGFIVVTWTYPYSGTDGDIYGRIFDQNANPLNIGGSSDDFVITGSASSDIASAVSTLLSGEFVTVWQDSNSSDSSGGRITRVEKELVRTSVGDGADDFITGDQLRDIMKGGNGEDLLVGGGGNDLLEGGAGRDRLEGGSGKDELEGGKGKDLLSGENGNDMLSGGKGGDELYGDKGKDKLFGNKGNDKLFGGGGKDRLDGGKGNDKLKGNSGNDKFVFKNNYDKDKVLDFQNNKDTIQLDDNLWNGTKSVSQVLNQFGTQVGADFVLDFGGGDVLTILNVTKSQLQNDIDII